MAIKEMNSITTKKSILVHACCAPCVCWPLEFLIDKFNITILYNNSNIYPESEYIIRRDEVINYIESFNKKNNVNVKIIIPEYKGKEYTKKLSILKDEPEGGKRCLFCYSTRMSEAYNYAAKNNFDYFTTVMTISRQKSSQTMNKIGKSLEMHHPNTKYFYSDFKKKQGMDKAVVIQKECNMYRQQYCGCIYSYQEYLIRKSDNEKKVK
jgi:hypothetical protein